MIKIFQKKLFKHYQISSNIFKHLIKFSITTKIYKQVKKTLVYQVSNFYKPQNFEYSVKRKLDFVFCSMHQWVYPVMIINTEGGEI